MLALPSIEMLDARLRGMRLPGDYFSVIPEEAALVAKLSGWTSDEPSPIFSYIAALRGLGITLEQMCNLCDFELGQGPVVGECRIQFFNAIQVSIRYRTDVVIHGIERRPSAAYGIVDRLRFSVALTEHSGSLVASVELIWLLPRRRV